MSFNTYDNLAQVLQEFDIRQADADFVMAESLPVREAFREDLEFSLREFAFEESEYGVCEAVIFPILKEVYRNHRDRLTLWSHKPLTYDEQLCGVPDYIVASRSPLGRAVFEMPYFVAIEAKRDDFVKGWGQCLAEMVAIQKLNGWGDDRAVFGMVSNGTLWEFGRLVGDRFERNFRGYTVYELERLLGAIDEVFRGCLA